MTDQNDHPWHAHVYYTSEARAVASDLRQRLRDHPLTLFVGAMIDGPAGPHPQPQFEVYFKARAKAAVVAMIRSTTLRALIHPLTDDDLADHTTLGEWIGDPLVLDESVFDPPGYNQGLARFGIGDF